jgi:hypothetical protein
MLPCETLFFWLLRNYAISISNLNSSRFARVQLSKLLAPYSCPHTVLLQSLRSHNTPAHTHGESSSHFASASLAALEFSCRNSLRCSFVLHSLPWRFFESLGYEGSTPSISTQSRSDPTLPHHIHKGVAQHRRRLWARL